MRDRGLGMVCGVLLNTLIMNPVFADNSGMAVAPLAAEESKAPHLTFEQKADMEAMIKISTDITRKISDIQSKQHAIDSAVYVTDVPILQAEKKTLQNELEALQMRKTELEAKQSVRVMKKQLDSDKAS